MNYEETDEEKFVRNESEKNNPYAKECPGRHLWSEGFRVGYKAARVMKTDKPFTELSPGEVVALSENIRESFWGKAKGGGNG